MKTAIAIILCTLFPAGLAAQAPSAGAPTVVENLSYRPGNPAWQLDLFLPANASGKLPAIVLIHGGGWRQGDKRSDKFFDEALRMAARGYVTASVNYRLAGEALFPACMQDVKCAVRWLRANSEKYHVDTQHIGSFGFSAGGHLALLLATSGGVAELEGDGPNRDQSSRVQAAVAYSGAIEFTGLLPNRRSEGAYPLEFLFGGPPDKKSALWRLASPLTHVSPDDPPILMISGMKDPIVPPDQPDPLIKAYTELGREAIVIKVSNAAHTVITSAAEVTRPAVDAFFARHLKGNPEAPTQRKRNKQ